MNIGDDLLSIGWETRHTLAINVLWKSCVSVHVSRAGQGNITQSFRVSTLEGWWWRWWWSLSSLIKEGLTSSSCLLLLLLFLLCLLSTVDDMGKLRLEKLEIGCLICIESSAVNWISISHTRGVEGTAYASFRFFKILYLTISFNSWVLSLTSSKLLHYEIR